MKIYNTLTRQKESFVPLTEGIVTMYVCGETVYNHMHVGHARMHVVFDTVRRYLAYKGYQVKMVKNFTDVDDKIIKRAQDENCTPQAVAERYIAAIFEDADGLAVQRADVHPRVTQDMQAIIDMISALVDKGFAYVENGSVFFDTSKAVDYGKLSKKNIDELDAGARVEINAEKHNPMDFVLWKPQKPGEPKWDSPWGEGRPGWHIECSAMAKKYLGDTIDIHGGGEDLIFPHHENEIAQSESANGVPFARYWMHNGMITAGHRKMSKSLGNFMFLREAAERFSFEVIRFYLLNGHYRMPIELTDPLLEAAQNGLARIRNCHNALLYVAEHTAAKVLSDAEKTYLAEAESYRKAFESSMEDDFNTADAVTAIYELVRYANAHVSVNQPDAVSQPFATQLAEQIAFLCGLLGLTMKQAESADAAIEALIAKRQEARKNKDWATADAIRNQLSEKGIILEDTTGGVRWSYKSGVES